MCPSPKTHPERVVQANPQFEFRGAEALANSLSKYARRLWTRRKLSRNWRSKLRASIGCCPVRSSSATRASWANMRRLNSSMCWSACSNSCGVSSCDIPQPLQSTPQGETRSALPSSPTPMVARARTKQPQGRAEPHLGVWDCPSDAAAYARKTGQAIASPRYWPRRAMPTARWPYQPAPEHQKVRARQAEATRKYMLAHWAKKRAEEARQRQ